LARCGRLTNVTAESSDSEVIAASLHKPELFAAIFQRHYPAIYRFVVGAVGPADGPDLASEVFVRAFAIRSRYDLSYSRATPWLFGIASNLVRGYHRGAARQLRAFRREAARVPESTEFEEDAVTRLAAVSQRPRITFALSQLRTEEAEVVLLFAVAELSYQDIAVAVGIPEGTVRSRLSRARNKLRNLIDINDERNSNNE
jgi:RNA polymerase sigma-70 factor (ECF subfamily)